MKKEKGFTLVEIMAVIIILGVVSLIAIPQVNKIIKEARMSVFEDSVYGVIRAGELYYHDRQVLDLDLVDTTFVFPEATGLDISGKKPSNGKMIITSDGDIKLAVSNGRYCARKGYNDSKISINENITNCTLESIGTENPGDNSGGSGNGGSTGGENPQNVIITNLELSTTSVSVINEGTYQIEATITPNNATNKSLRYTSNNTSIATVSSTGLITGISGGETTVTVTTQDGSNISKTIDVIVRQQISNVELDISSASIDVGQNVMVNATITPSNAYIKTLKWESSNESIATVNNGIITGVAPGVAVITATTQDGTLIENKVNVTVKSYSITYNTNGGTLSAGIITTYNAGSETFNLPVPTRTGYTFNGWYENADFSGNAVTQIVKGSTGNKTYYAKWTIENYSITYNLNSGTQGSGAKTSYTFETETFSLPTPTRTGYTFGGWYENADFGGNAVTQIVKGSTGNKTYYAKWTIINYSITYNLNSGTQGSGAKTSYTVDTATFNLPTPTRTNYIFGGWYEASDFSGSKATQITKGTTGNKTYYANWKRTVLTLYSYGNEFTDVTGGWTHKATMGAGTITFTKNTDNIYASWNWDGTYNAFKLITPTNPIDLTEVKTIQIVLSYNVGTYSHISPLRVYDTSLNLITGLDERNSSSATKGIFTLDVSSLTGSYYLGPYVRSQGVAGTLNMYELQLIY